MDQKTRDSKETAVNETENEKKSVEPDVIISTEADQTEVLLAPQETIVDSLNANPDEIKSAEISAITAATTNEVAETLTEPDTKIKPGSDPPSTIAPEEPTEPLSTVTSGQTRSKRKTHLILGSIVGVLAIALVGFLVVLQMQASQVNKALTMGESYLEEGKYEEAILAFDKVLDIDEKVVAAYEGKGASYLGLDDYVQAEEQLEAAKTIEFSDSGKILMADVYVNTDRKEDGLKLVEEVMVSNPEDTKTVIRLGDFYAQISEYNKVIEILEKRIELTEDPAELKKLYDELIPTYAKAGKTEVEILTLLEQAAKATGDEAYLVKKPTFGLGNTISNYANGGWAVETTDTDIFGVYTKGMAKYKNDELVTIINENSYKKQSLSYSNGWLYYSSAGDGESQGIYRRKLDSPEIQKLYGVNTEFILYDNEIYFALDSSLYKLNPEAPASPIKIMDIFSRRLAAIDNNWIYSKSENEIFRTKIDGSQQEIIFANDGYIDNLVIDGSYAYFIAKGKIYRTKTDQTETSVLLDPGDYDGSFNINNNKLYYAKSDHSQIMINQYDLNSNTTELIYSIDEERLTKDFDINEDPYLADPHPREIIVTSENIYLLSSHGITYCTHVLNKDNKTLKTLNSYLYARN